MLRPYLELPRAVHVLCIGTFVNRAGTFLIPFLTLYLTSKRGFSELAATSGAAICGAGSVVAALVGGHLADQVGRRRVMLLSLFGNAGVLLVFGFLHSPWTMLPALFVFTLLADMYRPAAQAMLSDLVEPERRSLSFGLMYTALNLGFGVGAWMGGKISGRLGFEWMFVIDASTSVIYAFIILFLIRETLGRHRAPPIEASIPADGDPVDPTTLPPPIEQVAEISAADAARRILRDRVFLLYCLASFFIGTVFVQSMTSFPLLFKRSYGINAETYGWIIAVNGFLIALCQLPITAATTRRNRANVMVLGSLALACGFGATELASTPVGLAVTVAIWTVGEMLMAPFNGPIVTDLAGPDMRARYFGVFGMSFSCALTLSTPLGGWVLQRFGGVALTRGCFFVALIAVAILIGLHRHIQPHAVSEPIRKAA